MDIVASQPVLQRAGESRPAAAGVGASHNGWMLWMLARVTPTVLQRAGEQVAEGSGAGTRTGGAMGAAVAMLNCPNLKSGWPQSQSQSGQSGAGRAGNRCWLAWPCVEHKGGVGDGGRAAGSGYTRLRTHAGGLWCVQGRASESAPSNAHFVSILTPTIISSESSIKRLPL